MSQVVFIFGAGASKETGAPLMGDFLERALQLHRQDTPNLDHPAFERVFQAISKLQVVHSKATLNLDNLETVFGALEMAKVIGLFPGATSEEIDELYSSFKKVIAQTLEQSVRYKVSEKQILPSESYGKFAKLLFRLWRGPKKRTCSVITFNYDVALDYALSFHNVPADYCLDPSADRAIVPYLKLHGSLNWVYTKETNRVIAWPCQEWFRNRVFMLDDVEDVPLQPCHRLATEHPKIGGEDYNPEPVLIPPTWNKTAYQANLANVWRRAAHELSDAEEIYVSGYSLIGTDAYFRYLFALGAVGPSRIRRFMVADPDPSGDVEKRFRNVLGADSGNKLDFRKAQFSQLVNITNDLLLPGEQIT